MAVYTSFLKNASLAELFKQHYQAIFSKWRPLPPLTSRDIKLPSVSEDQWNSIFNAFEFEIASFQVFVAARQAGISAGQIAGQNPLLSIDLTADWLESLTEATSLFRRIASCTNSQSPNALDLFFVYQSLVECLKAVKESSFGDDFISHCTDAISHFLNRYFSHDFISLFYYLLHSKAPSEGDSAVDLSYYSRESALKELEKLKGPLTESSQLQTEFDLFCRTEDPVFGTMPLVEYWTTVGKFHYPALSSIALMFLSYPSSQAAMELWSNMKSIIHFHVRSRKEAEVTSKVSDEMMISCNRHLLIRWDLDFQ